MRAVDVRFFFNFRSPYCYLVSKRIFALFDDFHVNVLWRPLGGWSGRSAPDRAAKKVPLTRQDVGRWCAHLGIPMTPPPISTDPTRAGAASFYAEQEGRLTSYVIETMRLEWAEGQDIGETDVLREAARRSELDADGLVAAADAPEHHDRLSRNAEEAESLGVIGVPTFVIDDQVFWGNDRLDFLRAELMARRAIRL